MPELPNYRRTMIASSLGMGWASATEALASKLHDSLVLYHEGQEQIATLKKEVSDLDVLIKKLTEALAKAEAANE